MARKRAAKLIQINNSACNDNDMLRGRKPEQGNGSRFKGQAGLSAQRSHFSWMRGCIWSCRFVSNSDGVRGGSPSHHDACHANDAARRCAEVWDGAPSGTAKRASRTATGTPHRTHRAAPRAAHRTRRATGRARRHHHPRHHRAEKVIGSFRANNGDRPASARAAKAVQRAPPTISSPTSSTQSASSGRRLKFGPDNFASIEVDQVALWPPSDRERRGPL